MKSSAGKPAGDFFYTQRYGRHLIDKSALWRGAYLSEHGTQSRKYKRVAACHDVGCEPGDGKAQLKHQAKVSATHSATLRGSDIFFVLPRVPLLGDFAEATPTLIAAPPWANESTALRAQNSAPPPLRNLLDNLQFIEQKNIASSHYANVYSIKNHTQYKLCVMAGSIVYQSAFEQVE